MIFKRIFKVRYLLMGLRIRLKPYNYVQQITIE